MNITIGDIMRLSNNVTSIASSLVEFRKQLADLTDEQLFSLNDAMGQVQWNIKRLEEYRVM